MTNFRQWNRLTCYRRLIVNEEKGQIPPPKKGFDFLLQTRLECIPFPPHGQRGQLVPFI
jgi:hypothetical protein